MVQLDLVEAEPEAERARELQRRLVELDDAVGRREPHAALLHEQRDGRRDGETAVLVSHHPDFFFEACAVGVDLQLSGHTHGGQIRVGGKAPIHHSRFGYERGWFREADSRLYVGRGVGVTVLPIRIDAPPEVPMITLRRVVHDVDEAAASGQFAREPATVGR